MRRSAEPRWPPRTAVYHEDGAARSAVPSQDNSHDWKYDEPDEPAVSEDDRAVLVQQALTMHSARQKRAAPVGRRLVVVRAAAAREANVGVGVASEALI
jgi:hypothetical protein